MSETISVLLVARYAPGEIAGGQAKVASYLLDRPMEGVRLHHVSLPHRSEQGRVLRAAKSLVASGKIVRTILARRIDVVHIFTPASRLALYEKAGFALLAKCLGRKTILAFHSAFDRWFAARTAPEQAVVRRLLGVNDRIECLHEGMREFLISERIVAAERVVTIRNGIDPSEFVSRERETGREKGEIVILFLGTVGYGKGIDVLVDAAARLVERGFGGDFRIEVIGFEERDGVVEELKARALGRALGSRIHFGGPRFGPDKWDAYAGADIFVLPSRSEGFPNTPMEAMLAGLPVVATDVGAVAEIVLDGETGFVISTGDEVMLATALERLIADRPLRLRMGRAARDRVCNLFHVDRMREHTRRMYLELCPRGG